jgi:hypothetical protein
MHNQSFLFCTDTFYGTVFKMHNHDGIVVAVPRAFSISPFHAVLGANE